LARVSRADLAFNAYLEKEKFCRSFHTNYSTIEHLDIDHSGIHVAVVYQLLNQADVLAPFQQVGGAT
jgi:hypothetical protein